jgi:hypothetical protein
VKGETAVAKANGTVETFEALDEALEAHQRWLREHPEEELESNRFWIQRQERYLAAARRSLRLGYSKGPRKGQPLEGRELRERKRQIKMLAESNRQRRARVAEILAAQG